MTTSNEKQEKAANWITSLFSGWGVPGGIARVIAGAIIGALSALAALSQSGCTASYTQNADGSHFEGSVVLPHSVTPQK